MRRGVTLLELLVVLAVIGAITALVAPRAASWMDRLAVQRATREVMVFYQRARFAAVFQSAGVRLEFSGDRLIAVRESWRLDTVLAWPGPERHGATLRASRRTIRIYPNGLGRGAANTKIVIRRGMAAESLTTSRLGRLKRWP